MKRNSIAIIGAGPAGIAAAIQLNRYGFEPVVYEKDIVGGLLKNANRIENYPGFPDGISGCDIIALLEKQIAKPGIRLERTVVNKVEFDDDFAIHCAGRVSRAEILIAAFGTTPKRLPDKITAPIEERVFYEVWPIREVVGKRIAIVGAGDAAFDYALNLARHNEVVILNRSARTKCLDLLRDEANQDPAIKYLPAISIEKTAFRNNEIVLYCKTPRDTDIICADYLLCAIGRDKNDAYFGERLLENADALTAERRLFIIGDLKNGDYRQAAIAVGDGVRAAMEIHFNLDR